jgi:hypothetical protein
MITIDIFFYTWLIFKLIEIARRILNKWKRGQGVNE